MSALCLAGCGALVGHAWQKCHDCATAAVVSVLEERERRRIEAAEAARRPQKRGGTSWPR